MLFPHKPLEPRGSACLLLLSDVVPFACMRGRNIQKPPKKNKKHTWPTFQMFTGRWKKIFLTLQSKIQLILFKTTQLWKTIIKYPCYTMNRAVYVHHSAENPGWASASQKEISLRAGFCPLMGLADYNPSCVAEHLRQDALACYGLLGKQREEARTTWEAQLRKSVTHDQASFLHSAEENKACLNLDLDPRRGWGLRSCRWPSLFLAFLRYLFKQKSFFFAVRGT